jgi:hypothetical protein
MNNIDQLKKFLMKMEKQNTYFYRHGGDIIFAFISIIIISSTFSYISFKKMSYKIKKNWQRYRCDPSVTPFAGFVNAPPNSNLKEKIDFTIKNFGACNMEVMESNIARVRDPITKIQEQTGGLFSFLAGTMDTIRGMYTFLKKMFDDMIGGFLNILANITTELFMFIGNLFDLLNRVGATLIAGFLFGISQAYVLLSFIKAIIPVCIMIIVTLIIIIVLFVTLSWIPVIGPMFYSLASWTILGYLILIPIIICIIIFAATVISKLDIQDRNCFEPNTKIQTTKGIKKIKHLKPGDILQNNNRVESVIKLNNNYNEPFYNVNGVLVTGGHYMYCEKQGWVMVKDANIAIKTNKTSNTLFSLVTSNKEILINDVRFSDWDDLEEHEKMYLKNKYNITKTNKLNKYITSLLHPKTKIKLKNNTEKSIQEIETGDILCHGEKVIGIVKSFAPETPYKYNINGETLIGKHIHFKNLGDYKKMTFKRYKEKYGKINNTFKDNKYYYYLITDTKSFYINNMCILDYNGCVENVLDNAIHQTF